MLAFTQCAGQHVFKARPAPRFRGRNAGGREAAPYNATAYHNLAYDYLKQRRYDDAVEMSAKAVAFRRTALAYSTLGRGYLEKGCTQDALLNLRAAVASEPDSFILWANLAEALYRIQPDSSNAAAAGVRTAELSKQALESTPDDPLADAQCGLNLARSGRTAEAIPYLARARDHGCLTRDSADRRAGFFSGGGTQ